MKNPYRMVAASFAWQQTLLFLLIGAAILITHGEIVRDPLYGLSPFAMRAGAAIFCFGMLYAYALSYDFTILRHCCCWVAIMVWSGFTVFYFVNDLHRIGFATCLLLAGSQMTGYFLEEHRPYLVKTRSLWRTVDISSQFHRALDLPVLTACAHGFSEGCLACTLNDQIINQQNQNNTKEIIR